MFKHLFPFLKSSNPLTLSVTIFNSSIIKVNKSQISRLNNYPTEQTVKKLSKRINHLLTFQHLSVVHDRYTMSLISTCFKVIQSCSCSSVDRAPSSSLIISTSVIVFLPALMDQDRFTPLPPQM